MATEINQIGIFARLKPTAAEAFSHSILRSDSCDVLTVKRSVGSEAKESSSYSFRFNKVIEDSASQRDTFLLVAKPMIDRVLQGFNATILAYGQTGSGKTYTIIGGPGSYEERGLVPRAITYLFQSLSAGNGESAVRISFMEIYNEFGFDLLSPNANIAQPEDFPRIAVMEDTNHNFHVRNLSLQPASNEKEALSLLFRGEANRVVAETGGNPSSSRSHAIFTLHVVACTSSAAARTTAKMHFVDLAGSERVSKAGLSGATLSEAKCINRSLHFLEMVVAALARRRGRRRQTAAPSHVPFRNSLLTSVLRDSLGGNCLTTFVITIAMDSLPETLSSCRFSQRAAMIENMASAQSDSSEDKEAEVGALRREVVHLKEQLRILSATDKRTHLTTEFTLQEVAECTRLEEEFSSLDSEAFDTCMSSNGPRFVKQCFRDSRGCALGKEDHQLELTAKLNETVAEVSRLRQVIEKKDLQICRLMALLKREKVHCSASRSEDGQEDVKKSGASVTDDPEDSRTTDVGKYTETAVADSSASASPSQGSASGKEAGSDGQRTPSMLGEAALDCASPLTDRGKTPGGAAAAQGRRRRLAHLGGGQPPAYSADTRSPPAPRRGPTDDEGGPLAAVVDGGGPWGRRVKGEGRDAQETPVLLTGDRDVDDEILAFYSARKRILKGNGGVE